jgi:ribose-phosphate pyrophosphokinase
VIVHCFPDSLVLARSLARSLGTRLARVDLHRFPDGETRVRVEPSDAPAVLVRSLDDPNAKIFELLLAASALRDAGAERVMLVAPYLAYMRQDAAFAPGEAVSQRVVGDLLGRSFDRVLCVEPHLHRVQSLAEVFPGGEAEGVSAAPAIADWISAQSRSGFVVGPDEESAPWVRAIAERARLPFAVAKKERHGDDAVEVHLPSGRAPCPRAWIVDDIASSGATLAATARALFAAGADEVGAVVVHAIVAPGAAERMRAAGISRFVSCDTIAHPTNAIHVAPLLAARLES